MSVTFPVSKVSPSAPYEYSKVSDTELQMTMQFLMEKKQPEAFGTRSTNLYSGHAPGFLAAVDIAFRDHVPLALSPDDVWLPIAQGFAIHVNQNAKEMRKLFVQHEGKKRIIIDRPDFVKGSPDNDWPACFGQFSDKIAEYIGKKRDLVSCEFSTTGPLEKAVSDIVLMDSMKAYFSYGVRTLCGIPSVTLLGTPRRLGQGS